MVVVIQNPYTKEKHDLIRSGCLDEIKIRELEDKERSYLQEKLQELEDDLTIHAEKSGLFDEVEKSKKFSKSKIYKEAIDLYHRADSLLKASRSHKQEIYRRYIKVNENG